MSFRRMAAVVLWIGAISLTVYLGLRHVGSSAAKKYFPPLGHQYSISSIERTFQVSISGSTGTFLLVVTSDCPFCLGLNAELDSLKAAAGCRGMDVIPLIVDLGAPTDSIRTLLANHGLTDPGIAGAEGLDSLQVWAVPTVIDLSRDGSVTSLANPRIEGTWPPRPNCTPSG